MSLARSYAEALLLAYQEENHSSAFSKCAVVADQLKLLSTIIDSNKNLKAALSSASLSSAEKLNILNSTMSLVSERHSGQKPDAIESKFLEILSNKGRVQFLGDISTALNKAVMAAQGGLVGEVHSAEELSQDELSELKTIFEKKFNCRVLLNSEIDPSLIAGVKVKLAGITYDGTLKGQVNRMKEFLVNQN